MFRYVLIMVFFLNSLNAIDATMEIVKQKKTLPQIAIDSNPTKLAKDLTALVSKDLQVSGHFSLSDFSLATEFVVAPNFNTLQQNGIDLYLNTNISFTPTNGGVASMRL
jgi:TolB protein